MLTALSGRYANTVTLAYDHAGRLASEGLTIAGQTLQCRADLRRARAGGDAELSGRRSGTAKLHPAAESAADQLSRRGGRITDLCRGRDGQHEHLWQCRGDDQQLPPGQSARLARNPTMPGANMLGTYSYSWDANKNKTAETIGAQGSGFGFSVPAEGYDQEDRITAWNGPTGPQPELDPLGRRRLDRALRRRREPDPDARGGA